MACAKFDFTDFMCDERSDTFDYYRHLFYFVMSFVAALLTYFNGKWEWFKWNPLNMIMLPQQIVDNDFKEMSHLELHELFIGNIVYIVIFLVLLVLF